MSLPKLLVFFSLVLFGAIGVAAYLKDKPSTETTSASGQEVVAFQLDLGEVEPVAVEVPQITRPQETKTTLEKRDAQGLPDADRIAQLFNRVDPKLPIVETIKYSSRVDWNNNKAAWLVDYARHYNTSRHFIARSLNGRPDYLTQKVNNGDRFNVIRPDKDIEFYLVVDSSRLRMWFYYHDKDSNERVLLKSYPVGLGRPDSGSPSGTLTPLGTYSLGKRIATFQEKATGFHQGEKVEMVQVFGSRWIPFEDEVANCSHPAKGYGIHGVPWEYDENQGKYRPQDETVGHYESDGCIRLKTDDMEELFAIIVTRPTTIEIVKDFYEAQLPGTEKNL